MAMATAPTSSNLTGEVRPADEVRLQLGMEFPILTAAYCIWQAQGLLAVVFSRQPNISLPEFLAWNYRPTSEPVGVYVGDNKLVGLGWICQVYKVDGRVVAEVGAAFFAGTPLSVWRRAIYLLMRHGFEERGYAAVYGRCPLYSRHARVLSVASGMKVIGQKFPWGEAVSNEEAVVELDRASWRFQSYKTAVRAIS